MKIEKVMIVDDDADIQAVARMALEIVSGWTVECVSEPENAIATATDWHPDVILLDWMMPNMTGLEVFEELRNNSATAQIPVIFMTAKVQPQDRETVAELGRDVIAKPFDPLLLGSQIEASVNGNADRAA